MLLYTTAQELQNAIGFHRHYGTSPASSLEAFNSSSNGELEYLLIQPHDISHILNTLYKTKNKEVKQKFFIMENNLSIMLRNALLIDVIIDDALTLREKVETFLDIYSNQYLTAKTLSIINSKLKVIQNDLHDNRTTCKGIVRFNKLKYKQIDMLNEIINLWLSLIKSNQIKKEEAELKYRDQRLRFMYKERYEYRQNLVDGDYIWGIKYNKLPVNVLIDDKIELKDKVNIDKNAPYEPLIRFNEYLLFRENGVAFPIHRSEENHQFFNVTLLDYIEGRKKENKDHCEVLGFWGDLVISPFWTFGIGVDTEDEMVKFYKKVNTEYQYSVYDIMEYNVEKLITGITNLYNNDYTNLHVEYLLDDKMIAFKRKDIFKGTIFLSYEGYETNKEYIESDSFLKSIFKEASFLIETIAFYTPIDIKKRSLLIEKQNESICKNLNIISDRYGIKYCVPKE